MEGFPEHLKFFLLNQNFQNVWKSSHTTEFWDLSASKKKNCVLCKYDYAIVAICCLDWYCLKNEKISELSFKVA